jgi:GH15 family glucan-1,4-alpha-glucosidase
MTETMTPPQCSVAPARTRYLPIAEHGIIGDLHSIALVGTDGTIDWYCPGRFDAPSVFGSLLDKDKGGFWRVAPAVPGGTSKQLYFPDTNVLITRFLTPEGVVEMQDFMPVSEPGTEHRQRIIRRLVAVRGELHLRLELEPRFDYARAKHETHVFEGGVVFHGPDLSLALDSAVPLEQTDRGVTAAFVLRESDTATFILESVDEGYETHAHSEEETRRLFDRTVEYWRRWLRQCKYQGRWRETVHRSALTLKLLTYQPSGAIVAAATTSLPEQLGGERNWDYRFTWIRDAAFSLYALLRLGFTEEAEAFMGWLQNRLNETMDGESGPLQIMYGIDGRADLEEIHLDHLEGYEGSFPVRIGNGAATQRQLDIYGEMIDSVYLYNKHGRPLYHDGWAALRRVIDWLCENWDQTDEGVWETRGGQQKFTYSRLMCWVAVERAIRIARQRGLPADLVRWMNIRDDIYEQIMERGWNEERQAFVQHYETDVLDASLLLMPLVKFIAPTDPRWLSTLDAIGNELVSDSLVYRYNVKASPDGLKGDEGTFSICSFWYVEALARAGRADEARLAFEKMLTYANHVGLFAEEIGPTGELLGNFPQAFTHLSLISAAVNLDRQLG